MNKGDFIKTLKREKEINTLQIEKLKGYNKSIDGVILQYATEQLETINVKKEELVKKDAFGPTKTIRNLFDQFPTKKWKPNDLLKNLNELKERGCLKSESKNLRYTVHWILRALKDEGYIKKIGKGHGSYYKKIIEMPPPKNEANETPED